MYSRSAHLSVLGGAVRCGVSLFVYEFTLLTSLRSHFFIAAAAAAVVVASVVAIVIFDLDSWSFAAAVSSSMHFIRAQEAKSDFGVRMQAAPDGILRYLLQNCITAQTQIIINVYLGEMKIVKQFLCERCFTILLDHKFS